MRTRQMHPKKWNGLSFFLFASLFHHDCLALSLSHTHNTHKFSPACARALSLWLSCYRYMFLSHSLAHWFSHISLLSFSLSLFLFSLSHYHSLSLSLSS